MRKSFLIIGRFIFLVLLLINTGFAIAQPAFSRGIQIINASLEECMRRAKAALQSEGYVNMSSGSDYYAGFKKINTSVITCNATSDGRCYINIFVASQTNDPDIPGAERVRLQGKMENTNADPNNNTNTNRSTNIPTPGVIQAAWTTQAGAYRGKNGERFTFYIPPGGTAERVRGSGVYTDDSSIGTAAVHAGLISFQNGGTVTIEIRAGLELYQASSHNGVSSGGFGRWPGSFVFVR